MRLKLRGKKNRKGQKVWAIYQVFGSREKLHKRLGPVPKELAETVLKKELVSSICRQENIRQNQDIALEKVFEEYLDLKAKPPHKSERTYKEECATSKRVLKHLKYLWGRQNPSKSQKLLIHDLNLNMLNAYKTFRRESGKSHRTINIELCLIRAALKHAIEQNYLARFNFELFKNLPEEAPRREWCSSDAEVRAIIEAAQSPATRLRLKIGFETGLRRSEILGLKLSDFDFNRRILTVYGEKENRYKEIPISQEMIELVRPLLSQRYSKNGKKLVPRTDAQKTYLFCGADGSRAKSFKGGFKRAREGAGIKRRITPHSMRHTFASHLLQNGANPVDVSSMLGHKKVSTTLDIYAHSSYEGKVNAIKKLPYLDSTKGKNPEGTAGETAISGSKSISSLSEEGVKCLIFKAPPAGIEPAANRLGSLFASLHYSLQLIDFNKNLLAQLTPLGGFQNGL